MKNVFFSLSLVTSLLLVRKTWSQDPPFPNELQTIADILSLKTVSWVSFPWIQELLFLPDFNVTLNKKKIKKVAFLLLESYDLFWYLLPVTFSVWQERVMEGNGGRCKKSQLLDKLITFFVSLMSLLLMKIFQFFLLLIFFFFFACSFFSNAHYELKSLTEAFCTHLPSTDKMLSLFLGEQKTQSLLS